MNALVFFDRLNKPYTYLSSFFLTYLSLLHYNVVPVIVKRLAKYLIQINFPHHSSPPQKSRIPPEKSPLSSPQICFSQPSQH